MNAGAWTAVAATAAAVSAFVSLASIRIVWRSSATQAKAADFDNCMRTIEWLAEALRKVRDARPEHTEFEIREYLNVLEGLALLINDDKIAPSTLRLVEKFLEEAWAAVRSDAGWRKLVEKSITGDETFAELLKFVARNKARIDALTKLYEKQRSIEHM